MKLFERLLYLHETPATLAAGYAERMRWDAEADRAGMLGELAAALTARNTWAADAERLAAELAEKCSPAQDFAGIDPETPGQAQAAPENPAQGDAEAQADAEHLAARVAALDALFCEICRALDAEGLTLTGGEISALKRQGWPEHLAAELDAIKRGHRATIPERERLGADDAAALWDGLTRQGLISGPAATFAYYLGQLSNRKPKGQESALCWRGTPMQFAYFIKRFAAVQTARLRSAGVFEQYESAGNNTAALCLAFGKDPDKIAALFKDLELQEENAKERQAQAAKERRAVIDAVFNTLPSLNK